ncbi:MAG: sugar ABC transporter ATP-binding protein [Mixta calida]|nr:sugar ABC transporter ATP-binding protein [Mixta calida]
MLSLRSVNQFYGQNHILWDVDLDLPPGTCTGIIGQPGMGKTTLVNCIMGHLPINSGSMMWQQDGSPPEDLLAQPADKRARLGIGYVPQGRQIFSQLSVEENLLIALLAGQDDRHCAIPPLVYDLFPALWQRRHQRSGELPLELQQHLALARALTLQPRLLILDEPTASLDASEVEMLFTLMNQLKAKGMSLIFVTHFLDQVYRVCDRITILRNGQYIATRDADTLPQLELIKLMLGRELMETALQRAGRTLKSDKPVVEFQNYSKKGTIEPFSLAVRPGEAVGLAGLLGSGRTETAEVLFGVRRADSGTAIIRGKKRTIRSPAQASRLGMGFCPEDRKTDGIIGAASVRENIILALQAQRGWLRPISKREQTDIAQRFIRQLGIRTPHAEQPIELLSGGNQQKVLLSRWLVTRPQFLILDEPTRGIDVGAHAEIIRLIESLCADGLALLVISSELEELVGYADRVVILRDRQQVAEIPLEKLSVAAIVGAIADGGARHA